MLDIDSSYEIKISGTDIYFDSQCAVPLSFVSSANISRVPPSGKIIATEETVKLLGNKIKNSTVICPPYRKPFNLGSLSVELIPSGQVLGGAQAVVEKNGKRIIYAGSFKLRHLSTAEHIELRRCDTLIMNCAYGAGDFAFPNSEVIMESVYEFVGNCFFAGKVPIILANPVGKIQDLIIFLGNKNIQIGLHPAMAKILRIYKELGMNMPCVGGIRRKNFENRVMIAPLFYKNSPVLKKLKNKKIAVVTGRAMESGWIARSSHGADIAFPLSNHHGHDEVSEYLDISKPKSVILRGNPSADLTKKLKEKGWNVTALKRPRQLALF